MAIIIPGHRFKESLGKQTAEGTPAANPDYQIPVYSGPVMSQETRNNIEIADGNSFRPGEYKSQAWGGGDVEWAAEPASAPRLVAAHFGTGSDTVTGAGDPRTHTMVRKDTPLFHTVWNGRPKSDGTFEYDRIEDALCQTLSINYNTGQLIRFGSTWLGKKAYTVATAPTPGAVVQVTSTNLGYYWKNNAAGTNLKLDLDTTPAVTNIRNFESFTISMSYPNMSLVWTDDLAARYFDIGQWELGFSGSFVVDDYQMYNASFYGSKTPSANTAQSSNVLAGSLIFVFDIGPTANANRIMTVTIPYMTFRSDAPAIDTGGAGIRASVTGVLQAPPAGDPITIAILNAIATAYS